MMKKICIHNVNLVENYILKGKRNTFLLISLSFFDKSW